MTTTQILLLAVAAVAVFGMVAVFAIAYRRESSKLPPDEFDRDARRADRSRPPAPVVTREPSAEPGEAAVAVLEAEAPPEEAPEAEVVRPVEVRRIEEVSPEEAGITRRQFFGKALATGFASFMAAFGLASLAMLWPKLSGGFGTKIDAGDIDDLKALLAQPDGTVDANMAYIPEARAYVVPFVGDTEDTPYEGIPVTAGGLTALFQRCVHLGCRVPWCDSSQGFECPCHGSKYNLHGEYDSGPAPRNLDRFVVELDDRNHLIIDTGQVIETPRTSVKTIAYPQGPSCI